MNYAGTYDSERAYCQLCMESMYMVMGTGMGTGMSPLEGWCILKDSG